MKAPKMKAPNMSHGSKYGFAKLEMHAIDVFKKITEADVHRIRNCAYEYGKRHGVKMITRVSFSKKNKLRLSVCKDPLRSGG